jgi:predicted nucleic acid-binding protein
MVSFLLDTKVISELVKPQPEARVVEFVVQATDPWLSSVTLHELAYGAERSPDLARKAKLNGWIAGIVAEFAGRILVVDEDIAELSGRLRALADAQGRTASVLDALIAASAQVRGLTLATRNTRDFQALGVASVNPWADPAI